MAPNSAAMAKSTTLSPTPSTVAAEQHAHNLSAISYVQCKNMQYNVIIIGWLGVIISCAVLMTTVLTMHMQPEIEHLLKETFLKGEVTPTQQRMLTNMLAVFSTILYALSLINTVVSLLLLIGVARDSSSLLFPWLLFHGMLFGVGLYVGIFYLAAGLFVDLSSFVLCLLVFALIMLIFYKTYHEVFSLFKVMDSQRHAVGSNFANTERDYRHLPYQTLYLPHI